MKKRYLFYTVWFFCALFFFLYRLFPEAEVKKYIEYRAKSAGYALHIGAVRPAPGPGLVFSPAEIREGDRVVKADAVKIMPCFFSLLGSSPAMDFRAEMYGGTVEGRVKREAAEKGDGRNIISDAVLSGIQLKEIAALQGMSAHGISGILEGTVTYSGSDSAGKGNADLRVRDLTVELGTPLLSIASLSFTDAAAKLDMENMQVQIRECTVKGNQLGGNMGGTVELKQPLGNSALNLAGSIKPHPSLIARMGEGMTALLFKSNRGKGEVPFAVRGTLEKPEFLMQ
ncbi:MAG: type II secretion system protein GspN [Desulfococcaceae bacterium]